MMHMTFYWGREVTILVNSWHTKTWLGYSLSLLACLLASIFYQYLENLRMRLKLISSGSVKAKPSPSATIDEPLLQTMGARAGGAVLFGINSGIGYLLMLVVMSFNGGVFLAVVLGLAIGYSLFRSEEENSMLLDNPCACA
ncbi:copper transporter 5.1-like [Populus alba x Populus x berolinensis]|uniref:Copper transport protein n=1 Tax=Populus alba x Populus x berolinensis TaxID=444605 RepID=A0AAD6QQ49_9ROSI|nr:copper transporter 5.1-like [Populus alba x Populus x berolinensis]